MKIQLIDEKLKALVKTERKITYEILLLIQTLDLTKSYRELGYSSLFEYLTQEVGYSEGSAQRRISSARLLKEIPEIEEDLKTGKLNLTQVSLAQTAFKQEEKKNIQKLDLKKKERVLSKLRNKNSFETKKILLEECPSFEIPKSHVNPSGNQKIQVTLEFTDQEFQEIQELLVRLSHKVPDQKLENALLYWAQEVKRKEQAKKASLQQKMKVDLPPLRQWKHKRKALPASVRTVLLQKAQHQCEFTSAQRKRCGSKHFLEIDHIRPRALGGGDGIENLRVLCRAHNQLAAKKLGLSG